MGWADQYIAKLQANETVKFRPHGTSMSGKVESGQLVTVQPIADFSSLTRGDIVLCKVAGAQYLHLIKAIDEPGRRALIGNNKGHDNGWTGEDKIYGRVTQVEP